MTRRPKSLSSEDRILWGQVTKTVRPLEEFPGGMPFEEEEPIAESKPPRQQANHAKMKTSTHAAKAMPKPVQQKMIVNPIEKNTKRKIAKGRLNLEARIDLHGLRQDEAHFLLRDFLERAHLRGLRHVLVITGKGSSLGSDGVLRRMVPQWLRMPGFSIFVSGVTEAAREHGGDGALYIKLKR